MYFTYHITFGNGPNPYFHFWDEKSLIKKSIYKWLKQNAFLATNRIDIFTPHHKYRISNTSWGEWGIYNGQNKFVKAFDKLGNALNYAEKLQEEN